MPKIRDELPPEGIEKELFDALERLANGKPNNPNLIRKANAGKLRINPTTVALEAGRSRTLCAYETCAYPRVYGEIQIYKSLKTKPTTSFEEINSKLTLENGELKDSIRLAMSRVAAMRLRMLAVDIDAKEKLAEAKRLSENATKVGSHEEITGQTTTVGNSTVVPIRRGVSRKPRFPR